jgi:hypothetical protein
MNGLCFVNTQALRQALQGLMVDASCAVSSRQAKGDAIGGVAWGHEVLTLKIKR